VGEYVPFYFAPRSPMLFRIQRGGVEDVSMWANTPDDPDRRRRRGAEFLVHQVLPFELVDVLCVYDGGARSEVAAAAADAGWEVEIHIRRNWYF
jgi:hypothetical protein